MCAHVSHFLTSRGIVAGFRDQPDGWERVEGDLAWDGIEWRNRGDKFVQSVPVCSIKANSVEF